MKTKITKWDNAAKYEAQTKVVEAALKTPEHFLDNLLAAMRRTNQPAVYLSGTRLDNDYCFGSLDVGVLFSVLPEDGHAPTPGFHPGSTEVYATFQGSLVMECLENGQVVDKAVAAGEVLVLPPGQCHRVRRDPDQKAASVILKTNLRYEPDVLRCFDKDGRHQCTQYTDVTVCPLHQRWVAETQTHS
jgi:mannose-6-phosphate isomerase-like protein (cupin superfamily)